MRSLQGGAPAQGIACGIRQTAIAVPVQGKVGRYIGSERVCHRTTDLRRRLCACLQLIGCLHITEREGAQQQGIADVGRTEAYVSTHQVKGIIAVGHTLYWWEIQTRRNRGYHKNAYPTGITAEASSRREQVNIIADHRSLTPRGRKITAGIAEVTEHTHIQAVAGIEDLVAE